MITDDKDGKLLVHIVSVNIRKPSNSGRHKHEIADFAFAMKQYLKHLADSIFAIWNDDKAKIPIGITIAQLGKPRS